MKNKRIIPILLLLIIIVYLAVYIVNDIPQKNIEHFSNSTNFVTNQNTNDNIKENSNTWKDNNPIKLGLYHYEESLGKRVLKDEYTASWTYHKDIISFNTFYTDEEEIPSTKNAILFEQYLDNYDDVSSYRIGYIIEFNDTKVQILNPKDTEIIYDTLEIYLYDAIAHKNDSWYSHVTTSDFNKNTLLQGIKLTAGKSINNITTDIKVTVFTYDEDDFDDNNNYKGNCTYTLTVKKS